MEVQAKRCRLRPSLHASERMINQGIGTNEVFETINKGAKRREGEKIVTTFRGMEIVLTKRPCRYFLITAYLLR